MISSALGRIARLFMMGGALRENSSTNELRCVTHGTTARDVRRVTPAGLDYNATDQGHRAIILSPNGDVARAVGMSVSESRQGLEAGEACLYNAHGQKIFLRADGIDVNGEVRTDSGIQCGGEVSTDEGGLSALWRRVRALETHYQAHVHNCTAPGSPSTPLTVPYVPTVE